MTHRELGAVLMAVPFCWILFELFVARSVKSNEVYLNVVAIGLALLSFVTGRLVAGRGLIDMLIEALK